MSKLKVLLKVTIVILIALAVYLLPWWVLLLTMISIVLKYKLDIKLPKPVSIALAIIGIHLLSIAAGYSEYGIAEPELSSRCAKHEKYLFNSFRYLDETRILNKAIDIGFKTGQLRGKTADGAIVGYILGSQMGYSSSEARRMLLEHEEFVSAPVVYCRDSFRKALFSYNFQKDLANRGLAISGVPYFGKFNMKVADLLTEIKSFF